MRSSALLSLCASLLVSSVHGKTLWATFPAVFSDVIRQTYPVGNGRLGAMPYGNPGAEKISLNIDSLWSGGPFQSDQYIGNNPNHTVYQYLPGIREWIFQNGTGNISQLLGSENYFGSYQVFGNLTVEIDGITSASKFNRSLDLDTGVHTTTYTTNNGSTITSTIYCSYPDQVCIYDLTSSSALPQISVFFDNQMTDPSFVNTSCSDGFARLRGVTQLGPPLGMVYDGVARIVGKASSHCDEDTLVVPATANNKKFTLSIGLGTNYDQKAGNKAANFSFQGPDPATYVQSVTSAVSGKSETEMRQAHIEDFSNLMSQFSLNLPDPVGSAGLETSIIMDRYNVNSSGDPFVESLLFDFGRYLFISSSRDNSLPPNLAGRWSETLVGAWNADYTLDINLQMAHWHVDQTGLGGLQGALWNFMEDTWVPRGTETAQLLYDAPGWVVHASINTFAFTAMIDVAMWTNYPVSGAWLMQHVFDHFTYSQDVTWLQEQAYPLMKGHAQFLLSQLEEDRYFNDGTLVYSPCNSPEHGPVTFACTNFQQLIHQFFTNTITVISSLPSPTADDKAFSASLAKALTTLDKGLHLSYFNTIKEWKIDGYDVPNDTHRHLSHLYGWYPGHSISDLLGGYENTTLTPYVANSLINRGPGDGEDADAGWEKVWRSACWARLNNTEEAYFELRFAISENFANNSLSMYSADFQPFQIDANFGLPGAMLSMLVVDLPYKEEVVLGPSVPAIWGGGSVNGLRVRGGGSVDFGWDDEGVVTWAKADGVSASRKLVNVKGTVLG